MTENKKKELINVENKVGGKKANHCCESIKEVEKLINDTKTILDNDIKTAKNISWWSYSSSLDQRIEKIRKSIRFLEDAKREIYECNCVRERHHERKTQTEQIERLKDNLKQLYENEHVTKLVSKEEELERLLYCLNVDNNANINRNEVENLRKAYKRWWQSRERKVKVGEAWDNIRTTKINLSTGLQVKFDDLQKIYDLCKDIAELQLKDEQHFEAKIEVPLHQI